MVIKTTDTSFKIIPRDYSHSLDQNVDFYSEGSGDNKAFDQIPTKENGYFIYSIIGAGFTEGQEFSVRIVCVLTDIVLWRGKVFITDQTTQNYSIYG